MDEDEDTSNFQKAKSNREYQSFTIGQPSHFGEVTSKTAYRHFSVKVLQSYASFVLLALFGNAYFTSLFVLLCS